MHCHGNWVLAGVARAREAGGMRPPPDPHYRHRFPAEVINHAVWLYHVFSLSLHETVRRWCRKFGQTLPMVCDAVSRGRETSGRETSGTSMRCSSGFRTFSITYGVP